MVIEKVVDDFLLHILTPTVMYKKGGNMIIGLQNKCMWNLMYANGSQGILLNTNVDYKQCIVKIVSIIKVEDSHKRVWCLYVDWLLHLYQTTKL